MNFNEIFGKNVTYDDIKSHFTLFTISSDNILKYTIIDTYLLVLCFKKLKNDSEN